MSKHVIYPILLNRAKNIPQQLLTYLTGVGPRHTVATAFWYIEGAEKKIIVDTGSTIDHQYHIKHLVAPDVIVEDIQSLDDGLKKVAIKPEDIDIVILTHLHTDHAEMAHRFTKAKFIVQKAELDFAANPHPSVAGQFVSMDFLKGLNLQVIEGDHEIVDGVRVWLTPGHTPGGQSVIIDTSKGKAVITGFCCVGRNFEPPQELSGRLPVIIPGFVMDVMQLYDSMVKVKQFADIVIPVHDAGFAERDRIP